MGTDQSVQPSDCGARRMRKIKRKYSGKERQESKSVCEKQLGVRARMSKTQATVGEKK